MCFKIRSFAQFDCTAVTYPTVLTSSGEALFHLPWAVRADRTLVLGPSLGCKDLASVDVMSLTALSLDCALCSPVFSEDL